MKQIGTVKSLTRYPVKSMLGEEIDTSYVTHKGLLGDRAYALIDTTSGKIISAKNPKKWGSLFFHSAKYSTEPSLKQVGTVQIHFSDSKTIESSNHEMDAVLSSYLGQDVTLTSLVPPKVQLEEHFAQIEEVQQDNGFIDADMANGTFFDLGMIHLLSTATLTHLNKTYPQSDFNVRRFRPNILIQLDDKGTPFVENGWIGKQIAIGDEVILQIKQATPRCIMTTLAQEKIPKDLNILKTLIHDNHGNIGVYAEIIQEGTFHANDPIYLIE